MKVDLEQLRERKEFINCQHEDSLLIWNYNHKCQYDRAWDEYTRMARGLITDMEGNIVARPFGKFFNLNETEETEVKRLPLEPMSIFEKLDGSLGIQYYVGDKVKIATRGSFNSEQAKWATEWMQERFDKGDFLEDFTYLYEIIYPQNRIVIDYKDRAELVLIAVIENEIGGEVVDIVEEARSLGLSSPKRIDGDFRQLAEEMDSLSSDEEGYVIRFVGGLRVKMKGSEYVRLHRLITGFSTKSIWECLMNNQDIDEILEKVPDEFFNWVKIKKSELLKAYEDTALQANKVYEVIKDLPDRKSQALKIMEIGKEHSSVVFAMLDNKPVDKLIWKRLKPKYELPFKEEI